jgi:DivIVA domain-containing protein
MELTPKVFRDVQFREKLRGGYHPEDVDEFLEQAAVGVEELTERLRQATERAQRAEVSATEASATDESLKRVLLMAQRTADQAIREAQAEAETAIREARDEADRTLTEAKVKARTLVGDAEDRARRAYEVSVAESRATMEKAEGSLDQVRRDVEALRAWVDVHKSHLLGVLSEAQALVESAGLLREPPPATFSSVPSTFSPYPAEEVTVPPAHSAGFPAEPDGETTGEHMDLGAQAEAEDNGSPTSDWDPRYLEDRGGASSEARSAPPVRPGANQEALALAGERIGEAKGVAPGDTDNAPSPEAAATIALDERALDSFFSERDLGDERGPSRFRRRQ